MDGPIYVDRIIRGGDWENCGDDYLTTTFRTDFASNMWSDMGFRGWLDPRASRYPMGKGARPEYSWWEGEKLTYLEARKRIYLPMYARAVVKTRAFDILMREYLTRGTLTLWDFDGYDHHALGMSFEEVLACPTRKMGHALVLSMLLETFAGKLAPVVSGSVIG